MPKVQITMSESLHTKLKTIAERDAPGAPNLSATGLRLLALGVAQEEEVRPLMPQPLPVSAEGPPPGPRPGERFVEREGPEPPGPLPKKVGRKR